MRYHRTRTDQSNSPGGTNMPPCIHASFGPTKCTTKTAYRSVQPFLHSSRQCRRACRNMPIPLKIPPSHTGIWTPSIIHVSLGPPDSASQTESRSVQPFLQGCGCALSQTDKTTDHTTRSVTIGRIRTMRPNNNHNNKRSK